MSSNTLRDPEPLLTPFCFVEIARPWLDLGYVVVPTRGRANKEPACSFWPYSGDGSPPISHPSRGFPRRWWRRAPSADELEDWGRADADGLLLLDSNTAGLPDLVVVDADDSALFDWCVATFGRTPLTVESGRVGGGRHHYYRVPAGGVVRSRNGCVGPTGAFGWKESKEDPAKGRWASKIDVKAHRAYVVAPGSLHKTGLVYTASLPITRDTILALPVFDVKVYESLVADWRMLPKPSTPKGSSSPGSKSSACTSDTVTVAGVAPEWVPLRAAHAAGLGRLDSCPWCGSTSSRVTSLRVGTGGALIAYCFSEDVGRVEVAEVSDIDFDALLGTDDGAIVEPLPNRADEFEADRKAGLVSDVFLFAKAMGDALVEHPLVIDHIALRVESRRLETLFEEPDERMSAGLSLSSIESPADIDVTEEDVEVGMGLLGGSTWINCTRGPWAYRPVEAGFTRWRIPCKSSLCPACGPWMMAARRAAATVVLGNLGRSGWSGAEPLSPLSASALRAVRRWVDEGTGSRAWIRSRSPDGTLRDLLAWATPSESPPVTTAVGKLLLGGRPRLAPFLEVWASEAIPVSDHVVDESKGVRVLTGTAWLVVRIHALRDKVLRPTGDGKSKITVAPPSEVKDRIERVAGGLAREVKGKGRASRHRVERGKGDPTEREMETVFDVLGAAGTWRRKGLPVGAFVELSLAAK